VDRGTARCTPTFDRRLPPNWGEDRKDNEYERPQRRQRLLRGRAESRPSVISPSSRLIVPAFEFAQVTFDLALQYPKATTVHLIMDNVNIHRSQLSRCLISGFWVKLSLGGDKTDNLLDTLLGAGYSS
jgi:hypothetical protein